MQARRGDHKVVVPHQSVQLRDRLHNFGTRALIAVLCDRRLGHDALGRKVLKKLLPACEPGQVTTQPRHDAESTLGDLAPQLRPERSRAGCSNDVSRGPSVACRGVGIRG